MVIRYLLSFCDSFAAGATDGPGFADFYQVNVKICIFFEYLFSSSRSQAGLHFTRFFLMKV